MSEAFNSGSFRDVGKYSVRLFTKFVWTRLIFDSSNKNALIFPIERLNKDPFFVATKTQVNPENIITDLTLGWDKMIPMPSIAENISRVIDNTNTPCSATVTYTLFDGEVIPIVFNIRFEVRPSHHLLDPSSPSFKNSLDGGRNNYNGTVEYQGPETDWTLLVKKNNPGSPVNKDPFDVMVKSGTSYEGLLNLTLK